jgi:hypothetical protein
MPDPSIVYEAVKATTRDFTPEIDGKKYPFTRNGQFYVRDKGIADELQAKYGYENLIVDPTTIPHPSDRGHKYRFVSIALPWAKYDELGRRIKED